MNNLKNIPKQPALSLAKGWQLKKLGEVCTYAKGKKPALLKDAKTKECSVPYINIKAFEKGIISEYTNGEKCNICDDDDLLMVWDGARCGLIGKAKKGAVGSTLMKILPMENIHKEYLYHFISSKFWTLNTKPKGVGIPHIEPTLLWNFELVVPPLPEQQAIVTKIEELLSELENGKQQLLTAQQQLKVYRQSLLKWAFEGKLTNKNVKEGELPKGWKIVDLKSITESIQYGYTESSSKEAIGPKFLRITDIQENKVDWNEVPFCKIDKETIKKYLLREGDLVFARTGATVGKSFLIRGKIPEAVFASYLIRVRVNLEINEKYLSYFFHSPNYWSQITEGQVGIGQPNVNGTTLGKLKIPIASLSEQQLIVSALESKLTVCDKIEETISQSLQQAETLRQSILKKAFEGKLVACKELPAAL